MNKEVFFYGGTRECSVMVTKESQGPWDLFSHSHKKKATGRKRKYVKETRTKIKFYSLASFKTRHFRQIMPFKYPHTILRCMFYSYL